MVVVFEGQESVIKLFILWSPTFRAERPISASGDRVVTGSLDRSRPWDHQGLKGVGLAQDIQIGRKTFQTSTELTVEARHRADYSVRKPGATHSQVSPD